MNEKLKVAAVQFTHKAGDKSANFEIIKKFAAKAVELEVELVIFPEMCITGYWHVRNMGKEGIAKIAEPFPSGESCQLLLKMAKEFGIAIGAGFIEYANDSCLYNTYAVAKPNGEIFRHRKLHCFISEHMESGDSYTVFEVKPGVKAGILICYDNNIIENARMTALLGADILIAPHQTGGCRTPSPLCMGAIDVELWRNREESQEAIETEFKGDKGRGWLMKWLPARAHDNGMFLIFSNGVGQDDDEIRTGNAMIIDPYGNILAETWKAKDDMVIADLDFSLLPNCTGRRWIKTRRSELYKMLTEKTGKEQNTRNVRFDYQDNN